MRQRIVLDSLYYSLVTQTQKELLTLVATDVRIRAHWGAYQGVHSWIGNMLDTHLNSAVKRATLNSEACNIVETLI